MRRNLAERLLWKGSKTVEATDGRKLQCELPVLAPSGALRRIQEIRWSSCLSSLPLTPRNSRKRTRNSDSREFGSLYVILSSSRSQFQCSPGCQACILRTMHVPSILSSFLHFGRQERERIPRRSTRQCTCMCVWMHAPPLVYFISAKKGDRRAEPTYRVMDRIHDHHFKILYERERNMKIDFTRILTAVSDERQPFYVYTSSLPVTSKRKQL